MNSNEVHFVAAHVRDVLTARDLIRVSVVKAMGGPEAVTRFISRQIQESREAFRASKDTRQMTVISEGYALLKTKLRAIIPETFGWWLEIDHDVEIRVRWLWLGHPAVTHSGSVSDCDLTIVLGLLRDVDWNAEATEAMASVEEAEAALLKSAQDRRRLRLTNSAHTLALPSIETLAPLQPPTLAQKKLEMGPRRIPKRRLTREEIEQRLAEADGPVPKQVHEYTPDEAPEEDDDEAHETAPRAALPPPRAEKSPGRVQTAPPPQPPPESKEAPFAPVIPMCDAAVTGVPRSVTDTRAFPRRGHSGFFLTRAPCLDGPLHSHTWEEFEDIAAILSAVRANAPGTYTAAHLYGNSYMKGAEQVWKSFGDGRPYPNAYRGRKPLRELTRREYDRLNTGTAEPRDPHRQRFSFG